MSEIDSGGPAFPVTPTDNSGQIAPTEYGLTKREWFAGMALSGMTGDQKLDADKAAFWAYDFADAMLRAGKGGK